MLQNKYSFNQSSVALEIIGLPDLSNNDKDQVISIISKWKLLILNQPEIEGSVDHLKSIIRSFYKYSTLILLEQELNLESNLINISLDENGLHKVTLKSTKPNIKPLELKIGNAELSDIINCFDQLQSFQKINLDFNELTPKIKKTKIKFFKRRNIRNLLFPPLLAILSMSFVSTIGIFIYENNKDSDIDISLIEKSKTSYMTTNEITL